MKLKLSIRTILIDLKYATYSLNYGLLLSISNLNISFKPKFVIIIEDCAKELRNSFGSSRMLLVYAEFFNITLTN